MNILIVDDDNITLLKLSHFLKQWGHTVYDAIDGRQALDVFLSTEIDMVITDWSMPEMDGMELVRELRRLLVDRPFVYVMLLTARSQKEDVITALADVRADDYIIKPFDPGELRARIQVGERMVLLERKLREYGHGLEQIVLNQTRVIRQTQEETIIRLLSTLESRDEETGGHVRRIGLLSAFLATAAGWPKSDIEDLRLAAPMHDIGKVGISDSILRKPGPLNAQEFEIIKTHTTIGGEIMKNSEYPMIRMARDIALHHHEKWNGSGYPDGLPGEEIPQPARIVSLVDVFDALIHTRVYRHALPEPEVLEMISEGRGTAFDPQYVDLMMDNLAMIRKIVAETP